MNGISIAGIGLAATAVAFGSFTALSYHDDPKNGESYLLGGLTAATSSGALLAAYYAGQSAAHSHLAPALAGVTLGSIGGYLLGQSLRDKHEGIADHGKYMFSLASDGIPSPQDFLSGRVPDYVQKHNPHWNN